MRGARRRLLLGALPCFFGKASARRLVHGPLRALRIGWERRDDVLAAWRKPAVRPRLGDVGSTYPNQFMNRVTGERLFHLHYCFR
jgi:hypothetical protein